MHPLLDSSGGTGVLAPPRPRLRPRRKEQGPEVPPAPPGGENPFDGSGGDWNGWNGGDGYEDSPASPSEDPRAEEIGRLALGLVMVGIGILFTILVVVWLVLRRRAPDFPPTAGSVPVGGLWLASLLLAASSATLERAARLSLRGRGKRYRIARWIGSTLLLGLAFLSVQFGILAGLWSAGHLPSSSGYGAVFYALTALHGLHVGGGLGYMAWTWVQVRDGSGRPLHCVRLAARFWHFMGILWGVLFVLFLSST